MLENDFTTVFSGFLQDQNRTMGSSRSHHLSSKKTERYGVAISPNRTACQVSPIKYLHITNTFIITVSIALALVNGWGDVLERLAEHEDKFTTELIGKLP